MSRPLASSSSTNVWDALQKKRAVSQAVSGKDSLAPALDALETTRNALVDRWASTDSFSRVDLMLGEYLKRGMYVEAFKYVIKLRQVIDTIITRLRDRVDAEGGLNPEDAAAVAQALNVKQTVLGRRAVTRQPTAGSSFFRQNSQTNVLLSSPSFGPSMKMMRHSSTGEMLPPISLAASSSRGDLDKSANNNNTNNSSVASKYYDEQDLKEQEVKTLRERVKALETINKEYEVKMTLLESRTKEAEDGMRSLTTQHNQALTRLAGRSGNINSMQNKTTLLEQKVSTLQNDVAVQRSLAEEHEKSLAAANDKCVKLKASLHAAQEALKQVQSHDGTAEFMLKRAERDMLEKDKLLKARNTAFVAARQNHEAQLKEMATHVALLEEGIRLRDDLLASHGIRLTPPAKVAQDAPSTPPSTSTPPLHPDSALKSKRRMESIYGKKKAKPKALLPLLASPLDAPREEELIHALTIDVTGVHPMGIAAVMEDDDDDDSNDEEQVVSLQPVSTPHHHNIAVPPPNPPVSHSQLDGT